MILTENISKGKCNNLHKLKKDKEEKFNQSNQKSLFSPCRLAELTLPFADICKLVVLWHLTTTVFICLVSPINLLAPELLFF